MLFRSKANAMYQPAIPAIMSPITSVHPAVRIQSIMTARPVRVQPVMSTIADRKDINVRRIFRTGILVTVQTMPVCWVPAKMAMPLSTTNAKPIAEQRSSMTVQQAPVLKAMSTTADKKDINVRRRFPTGFPVPVPAMSASSQNALPVTNRSEEHTSELQSR